MRSERVAARQAGTVCHIDAHLLPYRRYAAERRTAGFGSRCQQWSDKKTNWASGEADFVGPRAPRSLSGGSVFTMPCSRPAAVGSPGSPHQAHLERLYLDHVFRGEVMTRFGTCTWTDGERGADVRLLACFVVRFAQLTAMPRQEQSSVPEDQCSAAQRFVGCAGGSCPLRKRETGQLAPCLKA